MKSLLSRSEILRVRLRDVVRSDGIASILHGAGVTLVIRVVGAVLAFASQVALARWIGDEQYGIFLFAWTFGLMLALPCSLGLNQAALRFVPEHLARGEWSLLAGAIRRFRSLASAGALVGASAAAVLLFAFGDRLASYYVAPLYVILLAVPVFVLLNLYSELSRGFGWLGLAFAPQAIAVPLLLLGGVGALAASGRAGGGTRVLAVLGGVSSIVLVVQAVLFRRGLPPACRRATPAYQGRRWMRVALPLMMSESFIVVIGSTDILMLGALRGPADVAVYGAALRCTTVMALVFGAMSARSVPHYAALYARGQHDELRATVQSVIRWMFFPSLALSIALLAVGKPLLSLFGPEFVAGYGVLAIFVVKNLLFAMTGPVASLLDVTGNQVASASAYAGGALTNLVLNALLIPRWGIHGAAAATAVSALLMTGAGMLLVRHRLGFLPLLAPGR